jgi:hypothetical protein
MIQAGRMQRLVGEAIATSESVRVNGNQDFAAAVEIRSLNSSLTLNRAMDRRLVVNTINARATSSSTPS